MIARETTTINDRGLIVLPAKLRRRFGFGSGTLVTVEERDGGLLLRPAVAVPVEIYSDTERASFLLSNAIDDADYARASDAVRHLGIDPDTVPHLKPADARRFDQKAAGGIVTEEADSVRLSASA